ATLHAGSRPPTRQTAASGRVRLATRAIPRAHADRRNLRPTAGRNSRPWRRIPGTERAGPAAEDHVRKNAKAIRGSSIHASDGELGRVDDLLFDDEKWVVRYLVVDTGSWLTGRKVLISPIAVRRIDWEHGTVVVDLTRREVEQSPDVSTDRPVSRQQELRLFEYYGYQPYWWGYGTWGVGMYPGALAPVLGASGLAARNEPCAEPVAADETPEKKPDPHLRSMREVIGYHLRARDGDLGHVEDFVLDDTTFELVALIVDTRNFWPSKSVLISPKQVTHVSWPERRVGVSLTRARVRGEPPFDASLLERRQP